MSTTVWCKRDNGTAGPNYANVMGNFIAGGISNLRTIRRPTGAWEQTFQSALTVTAEGIIGAELIEFWPDIAHRYKVKKQAKLDATAAAARNAQAASICRPRSHVAPVTPLLTEAAGAGARGADRKGDHHPGLLPALDERAAERLQSKVESGASYRVGRRHGPAGAAWARRQKPGWRGARLRWPGDEV